MRAPLPIFAILSAISCSPSTPPPAPPPTPTASAPVAVDAPPAKEVKDTGWVRCYGDKNLSCESSAITDKVKAQLEAMPSKEDLFLTIAGKDRGELESLARIPWLRRLSLPNAEAIDDLAPLAALPNLVSLGIDRSKAPTLAPLAKLGKLESLKLGLCQNLGDKDLSAVAGLVGLKALYVDGCAIKDVSAVAKLVALEKLVLAGTDVTDLAPLKGLPKLYEVVLSGKLKSLAPLATLPSLRTLTVQFTDSVVDWSPLGKLVTVEVLKVEECNIKALPALGALTALRDLSLKGDVQLGSFLALATVPKLRSLDLSGTRIASLAPLAGSTSLETLDLDGTKVTSLTPLEKLPRLRKVVVPRELSAEARKALEKKLPGVEVVERKKP